MIPKMLRSLFALLLVGVGCGLAQVTIPDTPAGHTLQTWLDAINSGDRAKMEAYVKTVDQSQSVDGMIPFNNQTGGFELLSIESSEPLHIRFRVKEKRGPTLALGNLLLKDGQPPTVGTFGLRALPPGAVLENVTLDAAWRKKVIDGVNADLKEYYVEPAAAQQMADALNTHENKGDYDAISDGDAFAGRLTKDLRDVSHDRHLRVDFSPFKMPPRTKPSPEDEARFHQQMEHNNCAFNKVEILPNNIGYVKFDGFMDASFCGTTVVVPVNATNQ
jgi:retinol-binding protein 3